MISSALFKFLIIWIIVFVSIHLSYSSPLNESRKLNLEKNLKKNLEETNLRSNLELNQELNTKSNLQSNLQSNSESNSTSPFKNFLNLFRTKFIKMFKRDDLIDKNDLKLNNEEFVNLNSDSAKTLELMKKDADLGDAIKAKCYLNILNSFQHLTFLDVLFVRRYAIRSGWYKKNEELCISALNYGNQYRFFHGFVELKVYKLQLMFHLIKWKIEQMIKFKVWLLVMSARFNQAVFGPAFVRDEDIQLLIRLFYPELFLPLKAHR